MGTDENNLNRTEGPILPPAIGLFNERLKELIGHESVRAFGRKVGISDTTIRKYLTGETEPTLSRLAAMAIACEVSVAWLITGEGCKDLQSGRVVAPAACPTGEFLEEYALIDGFHTQVSTGHGALWENEQVKRKLAFRKKWLRYRGLHPESLRVVFAKGNSMEPTIHSGDSILVDTSDTTLTDGSIFVLRLDEEFYAKRLQKHIDGSITIISDNKEYAAQTVQTKDLDLLKIVGKVVWIGKDVK